MTMHAVQYVYGSEIWPVRDDVKKLKCIEKSMVKCLWSGSVRDGQTWGK